MDYVKLKLLS